MNHARPSLGSGWSLWGHVLVRGAGFRFALLDETLQAPLEAGAAWKVAVDPKFREAVAWQNPAALSNGIEALLRRPSGLQNARTRKQQLLVIKYLQRYCSKNDTIGFFGPLGWATAGGDPHYNGGASLISARATFFEPWAILSLSRAEAAGRSRLEAPVTLPGHLRLVPGGVLGPDKFFPLDEEEESLVLAADGSSAATLFEKVGATTRPSVAWLKTLERLATEGILRWNFPVSISLEPDAAWRALAHSDALESLHRQRSAVAEQAGNSAALIPALNALEAEFATRAQTAARRSFGQTYAGRGLVFEECRRDISLDLGRTTLEQITPPLRVVLAIARWYTFAIGTELAEALRKAYEGLGATPVPLHIFWHHTADLFDHAVPPIVAAAVRRLRVRWNGFWNSVQVEQGAQRLGVERATELVAEQFSAPCPGWPGARHHATDIMWAAASPQALLAGQGIPVLSELHPGLNPFSTLSVLALCPVVEDLVAEWKIDFPGPLISPIPWEDFARSSQDLRLARSHWHLDLGGPFVSEHPPDRCLRAADYDVVAVGRKLQIYHRCGGPTFDLLEAFERRIKLHAAVAFTLNDGDEAGPRRYLGPLLVQRAHWRVEKFPFLKNKSDRAGAVAGWRESLRLPRRIFVRSPLEIKPVYVDLCAPLSIEMLVHFARQAPYLSISEMYPGPDELWLSDAAGERYTSELRFLAVDPQPFDDAQVWGGQDAFDS